MWEFSPVLCKDQAGNRDRTIGSRTHCRHDRPLTCEQMAEDTITLLRQLGIEKADFFGYSMGSTIALQIAIKQPDLVRKLVVASPSYNNDGVYPEVLGREKT
ncbi:MAG: alpha/beta hydrolase [Methanosarcina flavescens]